MLSKVAERVYWTARYLERVESTARMISIYDQLLFDLPRSVKLSWYNLIRINNQEEAFNAIYTVLDERNVVKFMLSEASNSFSVASSLKAIRENVRTTRDVVPKDTWEMTNELSIFVQENLLQGVNRSKRHEFLETIIKGCQQILGLVYGSMPHDDAWHLLRIGRNIERADMTTRNLEAGISAILDMEDELAVINSHQIIWGKVLRSLNADHAYRRTKRVAVKDFPVAEYLLEDDEFPRSIRYNLNAIANSARELPHSADLEVALNRITKSLPVKQNGQLFLDASFKEHLNQIQIELAELHGLIYQAWFPKI